MFETGNVLGGHGWHLEERTVHLKYLSAEFRSQTARCLNTDDYQTDVCQPKLFVIGCEVRRPIRGHMITPRHKAARIFWCQQRRNWEKKSIGLTKAGFFFTWQMVVYVFGGREVQRMLLGTSKKQFRLVEALSWSGDAFPTIVRWILSLCKEFLLDKVTKLTYWKVP